MALPSYNIDFNTMVKKLLGAWDNKPVRVAWLTALFAGLKNVHSNFLLFTNQKIDEVKYNGQTFVLQKFLENKFGGGITIVNNIGSVDGAFVGDGSDFTSSIGDGSDVDSFIDESYTVFTYDFTVNVPASITFVQSEMEANIRKYKLFGKTFNIVIV
jgi:hypothetical protein